ncbi:hypothetical protein LXD69_05015 [Flavobacterium sediminilitoris]|uniref:Tox-MPTase4 domain-containing protein n=1 Tax=Flavobacterium sediminilitoris TaxID=2024526 RepID=A0ABY4HPR1_9FLAO|nr:MULTISPECIES: hypothetical protein [Flavobacterium]UOX34872.1 hypothetical protein LXD69_05015 [Flavobacterium sediminilitoris]
MSDFKQIINYLKFFRRSDEAALNNKHKEAIIVDESYKHNGIPHEDNFIFVEKKAVENQNGYVYLGHEIEDTLYLQRQPNGIIEYYIKKDFQINNETIAKYKRIPFYFTDIWEEKEGETFTAIETLGNYYYSQAIDKIIEISLDDVFVFPDYFVYHPNNIQDITNGDYRFNYKDEEGYTSDNSDLALRALLSTSYNLVSSETKRTVGFYKNDKAGFVFLLPKISQRGAKYYLEYTYYQKGISYNSFITETAIRLEFNYFGALLEFLNQTVFYGLDDLDAFNSNAKKLFLEDYTIFVENLLHFSSGTKILETLYFVPIFFFKKIDPNFLWYVLEKTLEYNVTNIGLNIEDIVLRILEGIYESSKNKDVFLLNLIEEKNQKKSYFSLLYEKMNGQNFVTLVQFLYNVWLKSSFIHFDNPYYTYDEGSLLIPYKSKKFAGFYSSNRNFDFKNGKHIEVSEDESWIDNIISVFDPNLGDYVNQIVEEQNKFSYHLFQPLMLTDVKQESPIPLPRLLPAFFLKANEDKAFWSNVITGIEYTVDAITTLSGFGNLAKFRHLQRIVKVATKYKFFDKAKKFNYLAKIRFGVSVIEISSGSLNALLKLTGLADTKFGKALTEYLFWLELLSLGGEITAAIKGGLRKSAKEVLEHTDDLKKTAKNADEAKQIDEVIEHLEDVAGETNELFRKIDELFDSSGGRLLTKKELDLLKDFLWQKYKVRVKLVDIDHSLKNKLTDWNKRNVLGSFRQGPPPELFLRSKNASELTVFHEMVHLKYWFDKKPKVHFVQEEIIVWEEIWKSKNKWTQKELFDSYIYVQDLVVEANKKGSKIKFDLNYEMEGLKFIYR